MNLLDSLDNFEVREFFSKSWLTHDAMWYGLSVNELGPDLANRLNKSAVRLMARIEIKRIMKLMGKERGKKMTSNEEIVEVIETAFDLVRTEFMNFDFSFTGTNLLSGKFNRCFVHDGVKKAGILETYECGIVERIKGWFDGLGAKFSMKPEFTGCLIHREGMCEIQFHFQPGK